MGEVHVLTHPLIQHKLAVLRDKTTDASTFRMVTEEIAMLMGYEAMSKLEVEEKEIETPFAKCKVKMLSGKKTAFVPIMRAGLGMLDGLLKLDPKAKVGHIGLCRNAGTYEPEEYFCKLPDKMNERDIFILDPMLATGGSIVAAVDAVKYYGAKNITYLSILACPEGIEHLQKEHPDVEIYTCCIDPGLDNNNYITPGLGDAGDRIYGTK